MVQQKNQRLDLDASEDGPQAKENLSFYSLTVWGGESLRQAPAVSQCVITWLSPQAIGYVQGWYQFVASFLQLPSPTAQSAALPAPEHWATCTVFIPHQCEVI